MLFYVSQSLYIIKTFDYLNKKNYLYNKKIRLFKKIRILYFDYIVIKI